MDEKFMSEDLKKTLGYINRTAKPAQDAANKYLSKIDLSHIYSTQKQISEQVKEVLKENYVSPFTSMEVKDFNPFHSYTPPELPEDLVPSDSIMIELQTEMNNSLKEIADNTSVLKQIMDIAQDSALDQKEQKIVLHSILEIAEAKDKQEADAKFKKAMITIGEYAEVANSLASMTTLAVTIFNALN